jgi:hypothetical protein
MPPSLGYNMDAVLYLEMSENPCHITWWHILDGGNLHTYRRQSLKSSMKSFK